VSSDAPEPVERLDLYLAASRIAHETVATLQRRLVARDRYDERVGGLVRDAARIASLELPDVLREARRLRALWSDQQLLDPGGAAETLRGLAAEMDRVEEKVSDARSRQDAAIRKLRDLTDEA
jgi:hypothetical protein